jgi:hypothetical protein
MTSPPGGFNVNGVSCISKDCVAVGSNSDLTSSVAEFWDGTNWTYDPPSTPGYLTGVSCNGRDQCLGVGVGAGVSEPALADYFDGSWSAASPSATPGFAGVDCVTAAETCMGVGSVLSLNASQWDGLTQSWTATTPLAPSGLNSPVFESVSCPVASFCVAQGEGLFGPENEANPMIEAWNGTSWALMDTSRVASGSTTVFAFSSVSCPSATFCMTVGYKTPVNTSNYEARPDSAYWGTLP